MNDYQVHDDVINNVRQLSIFNMTLNMKIILCLTLTLQSGLLAAEEEKKKRKESEDEEERRILRGPTIHEASISGNLVRLKELLQHFPEMKE